MVLTKASNQQNLDLSIQLWSKGVSPEDSLVYLKQHKYVINQITYSASSVAQGIAMIDRISGGLSSGKLKSSKAKGLYIS